jgi:oxygen-independent coproporphyrinogen-3 oxidase
MSIASVPTTAASSVPHGLYVHVPFCVRKCGYCDFYSIPQPGDRAAPDATRFMAALERELEMVVPREFRARTVFVGGGTPTELGQGDFERLLSLVATRVERASLLEWTVESNPGTLTREKARAMRAAGVTRVSMGVQSLDQANLAFLGRIHSAEEAVASYRLLREEGFGNVNLDFIFGIPGSELSRLRADISAVTALSPEHISFYCLIFEEGTPLMKRRSLGLVREVDEEEERRQYEAVREGLARAGYRHYEISNFARPGRECRHNLLYWGAGEYYGLGPSAAAHVGRARMSNVRDLGAYCDALLSGRLARAYEERLEPAAWAREALVMGLRRLDGVGRAAFHGATGFDLDALAGRALRRHVETGLLEDDGETVRLSEAGLFVSDGVFADLV